MALGFTFGGVALTGIERWGEGVISTIDSLVKVDRDGVASNTGKLAGRRVTVGGRITNSSEDSMRAAWATVLRSLYDDDGGNIKAVLKAFTDRQITAQVERHSVSFGKTTQSLHAADYTIEFFTDSPYWEATSTETISEANLSSGGTITWLATGVGDAICWPVITLSSAGTGLTAIITITYDTTGAVWTFGANVAAGKDLVIDMKNHTVTNDGVDAINNVTHPSSDWFPLRGNAAGQITLTFAGGAADVVFVAVIRKRYFNL